MCLRMVSALVVGLALANCPSITAQEIRLNAPQFTLLINDVVVKELKLTPDQRKQIDSLLAELVQEVEGQKRLIVRGHVDMDELETSSLKVLKDVQRKRLREAWIQLHGPMALTDAALAKEVGLKEEQSKKIVDAITNMNESMREIFHSSAGDQKKMTQEVKQLRSETSRQIEEYLTGEQKKKLDSLKGTIIEGLRPVTRK